LTHIEALVVAAAASKTVWFGSWEEHDCCSGAAATFIAISSQIPALPNLTLLRIVPMVKMSEQLQSSREQE
jgi:hypothetical protein